MARPREFDQDKALRAAIRLFSQQGFAGTSTDELMRVMGIGRQSMYDTFGDKRSLFLKALELYVSESVDSIMGELERPGPGLAAFEMPWWLRRTKRLVQLGRLYGNKRNL